MPTLASYRILTVLSVTVLFACGKDRSSPYSEDDKIFNQTGDGPGAAPAPIDTDDGFGGEEQKPKDDDLTDGGDDDSGNERDIIIDPEPDGDDDGDVDVLPDPETLISHTVSRTRFDHGTILKLRNNRDAKPPRLFLRRQIEKQLANDPGDLLESGQNFGDGTSLSQGFQNIVSKAGDEQASEGEDSASGQQTYERVTGYENCPSTFVCVTRLDFMPESGAGYSVCFFNESGDEIAAIPYAPVANYVEDDFIGAYGQWGPYTAKKYDTPGVDCTDPGVDPVVTETIVGDIQPSPSFDDSMQFHTEDPLAVDYGIDLRYSRLEDDNFAPYLDQTTGLQKRTQFLINNATADYVKIILTVRFPVDVPLIQIDGVQVDVHAEICSNELTKAQYCLPSLVNK